MNFYMISYDLIDRKNYDKVIEAIKAMANGYCSPLKSAWIIGHAGTVRDIINHIAKYVDQDDKVLVVKLSGEAGWTTSLDDENAQWIMKHLK